MRRPGTILFIFSVLVLCMAVCPLASAALSHASQSKSHCHEQKPIDHGKGDQKDPRCCGQQGIVKSSPDLFASWNTPAVLQIGDSDLTVHRFDVVSSDRDHPQRMAERLASLSVLRI